jgi:hypothetical protein
MTNTRTPTQAQIEAAELAKWIKQFKWKSVDKDNMEFELRTTCYVKDALDRWAALTAAAQVGTFEAGPDECDTGVALTKAIDAVLAEDTPLVNHTIERCAQVVEGISNRDTCLEAAKPHFAAAIRKLKEVDT